MMVAINIFVFSLQEAQETLNDVGSSYSTLMQQFTQTRQEKVEKTLFSM
jgi:hypothetical protein